MSLRLPAILAAAWTALLPLLASAEEPAVDFLRDVKPILAQRCFRCHSSLEQESGLRLDSVAAILKGGDGGTIVAAIRTCQSILVSPFMAAPPARCCSDSQIYPNLCAPFAVNHQSAPRAI